MAAIVSYIPKNYACINLRSSCTQVVLCLCAAGFALCCVLEYAWRTCLEMLEEHAWTLGPLFQCALPLGAFGVFFAQKDRTSAAWSGSTWSTSDLRNLMMKCLKGDWSHSCSSSKIIIASIGL